jgi:hypothetical protein
MTRRYEHDQSAPDLGLLATGDGAASAPSWRQACSALATRLGTALADRLAEASAERLHERVHKVRGRVILFSATRCCRRASVMAVPIHQPVARFAQLSQMLRGVPLIVRGRLKRIRGCRLE